MLTFATVAEPMLMLMLLLAIVLVLKVEKLKTKHQHCVDQLTQAQTKLDAQLRKRAESEAALKQRQHAESEAAALTEVCLIVGAWDRWTVM